VESYSLANGANNFTLGAVGQNVAGGTGDDTVHTGGATTVTGALNLGTGTDTLVIDTTGTTIAGATLTSVESIELGSNVNATMVLAQNALLGSAEGANTVTLANAGATSGGTQIESYILANGANNFTLGADAQSVTGGTEDDIVHTGVITTVTNNLNLGAGTDTLVIDTNDTNIASATLTSVEEIQLGTNVNAVMTLAQHALLTAAPGINTVTKTISLPTVLIISRSAPLPRT
jgi:hypothetical protein